MEKDFEELKKLADKSDVGFSIHYESSYGGWYGVIRSMDTTENWSGHDGSIETAIMGLHRALVELTLKIDIAEENAVPLPINRIEALIPDDLKEDNEVNLIAILSRTHE